VSFLEEGVKKKDERVKVFWGVSDQGGGILRFLQCCWERYRYDLIELSSFRGQDGGKRIVGRGKRDIRIRRI